MCQSHYTGSATAQGSSGQSLCRDGTRFKSYLDEKVFELSANLSHNGIGTLAGVLNERTGDRDSGRALDTHPDEC
jgi:hypothetical protein